MAEPCVMSAATRVELGIVVEAKTGPGGTQLLEELLARIGLVVAAVDGPLAHEALVGWRRFGKGRHAAGLNFGDCFSYALSRSHNPCSSSATTSRAPTCCAEPTGGVDGDRTVPVTSVAQR